MESATGPLTWSNGGTRGWPSLWGIIGDANRFRDSVKLEAAKRRNGGHDVTPAGPTRGRLPGVRLTADGGRVSRSAESS